MRATYQAATTTAGRKIFTCIIPHVDAKNKRAIDRFLVSQSEQAGKDLVVFSRTIV